MYSIVNFRSGLVLTLLLFLFVSSASSAEDTKEKWAPVRGMPGDFWADVIIGKPDFNEVVPGEVNQERLGQATNGLAGTRRCCAPGCRWSAG